MVSDQQEFNNIPIITIHKIHDREEGAPDIPVDMSFNTDLMKAHILEVSGVREPSEEYVDKFVANMLTKAAYGEDGYSLEKILDFSGSLL